MKKAIPAITAIGAGYTASATAYIHALAASHAMGLVGAPAITHALASLGFGAVAVGGAGMTGVLQQYLSLLAVSYMECITGMKILEQKKEKPRKIGNNLMVLVNM